jgi:hypothetical protein
MSQPNEAQAPETKEERRQFLERIGKYAAVTSARHLLDAGGVNGPSSCCRKQPRHRRAFCGPQLFRRTGPST